MHDGPDPRNLDFHQIVTALARQFGADYFRWFFPDRMATLGHSLAAGLESYKWAVQHHGQEAALTSSALWCSCPNVILCSSGRSAGGRPSVMVGTAKTILAGKTGYESRQVHEVHTAV